MSPAVLSGERLGRAEVGGFNLEDDVPVITDFRIVLQVDLHAASGRKNPPGRFQQRVKVGLDFFARGKRQYIGRPLPFSLDRWGSSHWVRLLCSHHTVFAKD